MLLIVVASMEGPFDLLEIRRLQIASIFRTKRLVGAFVITLVLALAPSAIADDFCMTDEELRAYLFEVSEFGLGRGAAPCWRKYKSFRAAWPKYVHALENALRTHSAKNYAHAIRPYKRSFGHDAEAMYQRALEAATAASIRATAKYSEEQCGTYLQAIEGLSLTGPDGFVTLFVDPVFADERQQISECKE